MTTATGMLFRRANDPSVYSLLRRRTDPYAGFEELDLVPPPSRFWSDGDVANSGPALSQDAQRCTVVPTPAKLLTTEPVDSWAAMSKRSLAQLHSWFLVIEDPQRRLEAKAIVPLAHQASVVQHIQEQLSLRRVLLADEVGLGKTIEAGLLIQQVVAMNPGARVLYLAPARLVRNVRLEFDKMGLNFRSWVASADRDATMTDNRIVASIHRASNKNNIEEVTAAGLWDMIVVDECHHLSDWAPGGGSPVAQYKLVDRLSERLKDGGRLLLMSGTPNQGHPDRFKNVLKLLRKKGEDESVLAGRVIFRTKDDVVDWDGQPLFPGRKVNPPHVLDLGQKHRQWLQGIHHLFEPVENDAGGTSQERRAAGWRAGQALQWATSSVHAGLGYLVRQAIRARRTPSSMPPLERALGAIRPYRLGQDDEPIPDLFKRITIEVDRQLADADIEDIEDVDESGKWTPDLPQLAKLLDVGVQILKESADAKWEFLYEKILGEVGAEKVVLFAQPIETVTAVAAYLTRKTGRRPALILGGQSDTARSDQVKMFWDPNGPQFLVSSRAGGEGLNLQVARRLVHLDIPWNPMEMEQRIGRIHRFGSRRTVIVDTVVVKDSREMDTYAKARAKLEAIVKGLVPPDRVEALFGRVMALVPPEELQNIFGKGGIGPLTTDDESKLSALVSEGYVRWKQFHDEYSAADKNIRALKPGTATWGDVAKYAKNYLDASEAAGFSALKFILQGGESVASPTGAMVISIDGSAYACGDYGGMPVTQDNGISAKQFGTNLKVFAKALRTHTAFNALNVGAAHLRWPSDLPGRPTQDTFGVLVFARSVLRPSQGSFVEKVQEIICQIVLEDGTRTSIPTEMKGDFIRALLLGTVRTKPEDAPKLVAEIGSAEQALFVELLKQSTTDERVVATPLFAAIVA